MGKSLRISTFIPVKLLNNPVTSCYLKNFDFLLFHAEHFEKSIILPFLVFTTLGGLFLIFCSLQTIR